jgi:hypothetical protein
MSTFGSDAWLLDQLRNTLAYPEYCPYTGDTYTQAEREFHVMSYHGLICQDCTDPAVASLVATRVPMCERYLATMLRSMTR